MENAYHCSALFARMLLLQSQQGGLSLAVDTSMLEAEVLLKGMRDAEPVALARPAADFVVRRQGVYVC
jgi:hypothetical protein